VPLCADVDHLSYGSAWQCGEDTLRDADAAQVVTSSRTLVCSKCARLNARGPSWLTPLARSSAA
jgi:hypothetical protein